MTAGIKAVSDLLMGAEAVVISTHVKPDGDALGSMLGLADVLRRAGKKVVCYLEDAVPKHYMFLPGTDSIIDSSVDVKRETAGYERVVSVALDCGDVGRLGKCWLLLARIRPFCVIDHHRGNTGFGDINWIESNRSSTAEMICDLVEIMGLDFSPPSAVCLYTGIVTDTGSFRYASTSSHTHKVAAHLVDCGADPGEINASLYDNYSLGRLRLMQLVLATLEVFADEQIAVIRATREMMAETGTGAEDTENFINIPMAVGTVQVTVFLKEGENNVSVSLRSRERINVAKVAACFGGGGHAMASGFLVQGRGLDAVWARLLPVIVQRLDGGQKTEDRGQRTEDRGQRTEDRMVSSQRLI